MKKKAQGQVLNHFLRGRSLTVVSCRENFHSTELRRIVSRLRKRGYDIADHWQLENGDRFKTYFISQKPKHEESPEDRQADRNFCGSFSGYSVNPFRERAE